MPNTKATGVAYLDPEFSTCYATEELGYTNAANGTVTQITSKATAVTLNTSTGQITTNNASLGAGATALFTLTNNRISAKDTLIVNIGAGGTAGAYWPYVAGLTAGSATIGIYNNTGGALAEAPVINFAIIHAGV